MQVTKNTPAGNKKYKVCSSTQNNHTVFSASSTKSENLLKISYCNRCFKQLPA